MSTTDQLLTDAFRQWCNDHPDAMASTERHPVLVFSEHVEALAFGLFPDVAADQAPAE